MIADVTGLPLQTVGPAEGAPLGAAMLAAVGAGTIGSVASAGAAWLNPIGRTEPAASQADAYEEAYQRYVSLYPALEEWFGKALGSSANRSSLAPLGVCPSTRIVIAGLRSPAPFMPPSGTWV